MKQYLSLVKFSHTIFALPFAVLGYFLAYAQLGVDWSWRTFGLILLCMVFARSAAMAFNRYLDRDIDALNPRTAVRDIPSGRVSPRQAMVFILINSLLFVGCTWLINPLCFALSPLALLIVLGYSYTKRFTFLCHFVLGLGLSLAPIGSYLAAGGGFDALPLLYAGVVLLWVSGFDILYALQDEEFDRENNLYSVPTWLGRKRAMVLSSVLHIGCGVLVLIGTSMLFELPGAIFYWIQAVAAVLFVSLLVYQHRLVSPDDISRVDLAFFTTNGVASVVFCGLVVLDVFV